MAVIRLILLIAIMGGLTLLLVQNWSPALSLVFLGIRSQQLPLAMWILFSTVAGAATSLLITSLFRLSNYFAPSQIPLTSATTARRTKTKSREQFTSEPSSPPPPKSKPESANQERFDEDFDDWENNSANDDWDFEEQQTPPPQSNSPTDSRRDSTSYERPQKPKTGSRSGSTYSYSYREPKNTAAGKAESVYDADYRVIIPPHNELTNDEVNNEEDDDWSFFEDENWEDDKPRK
ncbi:MAG TPA: LapA family protein [Trichormus sp. M33_DOE_039]|nr:LapA family protein [Trichormus sp. M33_DOE_039]